MTHNGETSVFVYDLAGLGDVVGEYDSGGDLITHYDHAFGLVDRAAADGSQAYYLFDVLGSTTVMTDAAGAVLDRYRYMPFGQAHTTPLETVPNDFEFVGEQGVMADAGGMSFMRARFYDPVAGRFTQRDPIGVMGGLNLFVYAENDPVRGTDPSRLFSPLLNGEYFNFLFQTAEAIGGQKALIQMAGRMATAMDALSVRQAFFYVMDTRGLREAIRQFLPMVNQAVRQQALRDARIDVARFYGTLQKAEVAATSGAVAAGSGSLLSFTARAAGYITLGWTIGAYGARGVGGATGSQTATDVGDAMLTPFSFAGWGVAYDFYKDWIFGS